ncbi:MAG: fatty acid desaturase [Deltaproteobacteria bacterium]|nr:fatty acid desaturase [Deltaproteobacteria bacterium]
MASSAGADSRQFRAGRVVAERIEEASNLDLCEAPNRSTGLISEFAHSRGELFNRSGASYLEFKLSLAPRYPRTWLNITGGYLALIMTAVAMMVVHAVPLLPAAVAVLLGALSFGWWIHYLILFFHEALHFNLAPTKQWNDRLAAVFISPLLGFNVATFRDAHFEHHRHLGTPQDNEVSYFSALTPRFIVESILGIRIVRALVAKRRYLQHTQAPSAVAWPTLLSSAAFHGSVIGASLVAAQYALAIAWVAAMISVAPALNLIRQILEHRDFAAQSSTDYSRVVHGPVARIFGDGPLASTFGAAGFNRHLLHHLEPQISCTRLRELESFLNDTALATRLAVCRTTYWTTFVRLLRA